MLNLDIRLLGEVVLRTSIVYLVVVVGLRFLGKRELGQMTIVDLVLLLTLSNAVQNAMTGPDTSLTGGLVSAATLLVLDRLFAFLNHRSPGLRHVFRGEPTLLIHEGQLLSAHLKREGIDEEDVHQALREHGIDDIARVRSAILEVDGSISVVPEDAPVVRTHKRHWARRPTGPA